MSRAGQSLPAKSARGENKDRVGRAGVGPVDPPDKAMEQWLRLPSAHTPSIAFRHFPPNSTRFSYATEEALFISAPSERFGY